MKPYPLHFQPEWKERVWGGRALARFGFDLPDGPIGEAWTIGDHPNGVSTVMNGPLAGKGLDWVRERFGQAWFGTKFAGGDGGRFPLLIKLLDCNDDLSVQVHPSDDYEKLPPGEPGKTEMWYVIDAKPGAKIIYGIKDGITRDDFAAAIEADRIMDTLRVVDVEAGDMFYIPAGTVHALCAGVLVAEIQQNSDTTYRLFDYNRPGLDGKPRELHIEDSLRVTNFDNAGAERRKTAVDAPNTWLHLATSAYFSTDKAVVRGEWTETTDADSFTILIVTDGSGSLKWAEGELALAPGACFLLPAPLGAYTLTGDCTVLRSRLP